MVLVHNVNGLVKCGVFPPLVSCATSLTVDYLSDMRVLLYSIIILMEKLFNQSSVCIAVVWQNGFVDSAVLLLYLQKSITDLIPCRMPHVS